MRVEDFKKFIEKQGFLKQIKVTDHRGYCAEKELFYKEKKEVLILLFEYLKTLKFKNQIDLAEDSFKEEIVIIFKDDRFESYSHPYNNSCSYKVLLKLLLNDKKILIQMVYSLPFLKDTDNLSEQSVDIFFEYTRNLKEDMELLKKISFNDFTKYLKTIGKEYYVASQQDKEVNYVNDLYFLLDNLKVYGFYSFEEVFKKLDDFKVNNSSYLTSLISSSYQRFINTHTEIKKLFIERISELLKLSGVKDISFEVERESENLFSVEFKCVDGYFLIMRVVYILNLQKMDFSFIKIKDFSSLFREENTEFIAHNFFKEVLKVSKNVNDFLKEHKEYFKTKLLIRKKRDFDKATVHYNELSDLREVCNLIEKFEV